MNGTSNPDINGPALDGMTVRLYLLDELTPDARERLEERLLLEDDLFAQLLRLEDEQEDELIDQYVHGQLSQSEHEKFERVFLSTPERQEKLNLVRDLKAHVASTVFHAQEKPKDKKKKGDGFSSFLAFLHFQNPLVGFSLAVILLLSAVSSVWLFSKVRRLESEVSGLRAERQAVSPPAPTPDQSLQDQLTKLKARNDELEADLQHADAERDKLNQQLALLKSQEREAKERAARRPTGAQQTPVLSLVLPLIRSRSSDAGQVEELDLPTGPTRVRLLLDLDIIDPADYQSYQTVIKRRGGTVVWRGNSPTVSTGDGQNRIVVSPPARRLNTGEHLVELSGIPPGGSRVIVGIYTFRVTKR